uniref:ML domain-containing protein n=1 Tax=Haemonchus contortus TaxID=6289 RepID=A0A7I4Z3B0_HAECO
MWFLAVILMLLSFPSSAEKAEVKIRVSGACSPVYLQRKGIDINKYRPSIRFNPDKIHLLPENPLIPGCVKIKAEGVEITRPLRNLVAEVELRIGGTPNPTNPTLPCSKKIDGRINQCFCSKVEGTCVFCDFCKQLKTQSSISATKKFTAHKNIGDDCKMAQSTVACFLLGIDVKVALPQYV